MDYVLIYLELQLLGNEVQKLFIWMIGKQYPEALLPNLTKAQCYVLCSAAVYGCISNGACVSESVSTRCQEIFTIDHYVDWESVSIQCTGILFSDRYVNRESVSIWCTEMFISDYHVDRE